MIKLKQDCELINNVLVIIMHEWTHTHVGSYVFIIRFVEISL